MAPLQIFKHLNFQPALWRNNVHSQSNLKKWELGIVIALSLLLSTIYYFPIVNSGENLGIQDWDQNFAWTEATRISLLEYHQFPLWNPYKCGGTVQFANPQVPVISVQTIFALLLGTLSGIKISIFFHGVFGFIGFYYLARQYKQSYLGSGLAAIIFSFSGITGSFLSSGMVVFTSYAYTPYILICFNKSLDNLKWGIVAGFLFALSFYYSYQIPLLLGVYLLVYTLVESIVKRTLIPAKALGIMVFISSLLILPRLFLVYQLLRISPRQLADISGYNIQNLFYFLFSQKQNLFTDMNIQGFTYGIDENSLYVGILSTVIFLLFFIKNKKAIGNNLTLIIALFIMVWLMLGNGVYPSLYGMLKHLPIFSSFRVAQRFRFDFIIPFAIIVGLGLDNLLRLLLQYKLTKPIALMCLGFIYFDLTIFSTVNFISKTLIIVNPEDQLMRGQTFVQTVANNPDFEVQRSIEIPDRYLNESTFYPWSYEYLKIRQNEGVLECYDPIPLGVKAIGIGEENYKGEYYLLEELASIKVVNTFWSPNRLIFDITDASGLLSNTLIINQNFYPGWIVIKDDRNCERAIFNKGLLATMLDDAIESVTFEFKPLEYYTACR